VNTRISTLSPILAIALAACGVPDSPILELGPDVPTTTDALALTLSSPADSSDNIDYDVAWTRDGEGVSAYANARTIPAFETTKGETWVATVTPVRGGREGTPVSA
jgi:hypothetical protein